MATSSPTTTTEFSSYEAYLRRFGDLQARGAVSIVHRSLSFRRYLALREGRSHEDLERSLFPPAGAALRVYLASPLGFSESGTAYREELHDALSALGAEVLDPWDDAVFPGRIEEALAIGRQNFRLIESCGRVLAVLDGPDVDSGVACELGYAHVLGLRLDGIRSDGRAAGECPALAVNLQVATTIVTSGGRIVRSVDELPTLEWQRPRLPSTLVDAVTQA